MMITHQMHRSYQDLHMQPTIIGCTTDIKYDVADYRPAVRDIFGHFARTGP